MKTIHFNCNFKVIYFNEGAFPAWCELATLCQTPVWGSLGAFILRLLLSSILLFFSESTLSQIRCFFLKELHWFSMEVQNMVTFKLHNRSFPNWFMGELGERNNIYTSVRRCIWIYHSYWSITQCKSGNFQGNKNKQHQYLPEKAMLD